MDEDDDESEYLLYADDINEEEEENDFTEAQKIELSRHCYRKDNTVIPIESILPIFLKLGVLKHNYLVNSTNNMSKRISKKPIKTLLEFISGKKEIPIQTLNNFLKRDKILWNQFVKFIRSPPEKYKNISINLNQYDILDKLIDLIVKINPHNIRTSFDQINKLSTPENRKLLETIVDLDKNTLPSHITKKLCESISKSPIVKNCYIQRRRQSLFAVCQRCQRCQRNSTIEVGNHIDAILRIEYFCDDIIVDIDILPLHYTSLITIRREITSQKKKYYGQIYNRLKS